MRHQQIQRVVSGVLGILVLCAYAGCAIHNTLPATLSYISSQQGTGVDGKNSQQKAHNGPQAQDLGLQDLTIQTPDGDVVFHVQVADTEATRTVGLMYREKMPATEGMVFLFDQPQSLTFWMKNTLIPLDMIFINKDWKVVTIQKSAQPCTSDPCVLYPSNANAQYVLEINAGLSDKLGIQQGAKVQLQQ